MDKTISVPHERVWLLDALRGVAALAVLIWHYQHFYYADARIDAGFVVSQQPLYWVLWPFYLYGHYAVQIFFVLSGFVFFMQYFERVATGRLSLSQYSIDRFARLYPLHLATLLLVALGQAAAMRLTGAYFVYPHNDTYHFVLNLLLAPYWGLQSGHSFNAPVWSVSVEIIAYAGFFVFAAALGARRRAPAYLIFAMPIFAVASAFAGHSAAIILTAAACFTAGGLTYFVWKSARGWPRRSAVAAALLAFALAAALASIPWGDARPLAWKFGVVPLFVLGLSLAQHALPNAGRSMCSLGDISLAVYLMHFPVQLATVLCVAILGIAIDYNHPAALAAFTSVVVAIAIPVHYHFELPVKVSIRTLMRKRHADAVLS